jgi:hypothetical protein
MRLDGEYPEVVAEQGETPRPTQKTQPKGKDEKGQPAKPETIPVPMRDVFVRNLKKIADKPEPKKAQAGRPPNKDG